MKKKIICIFMIIISLLLVTSLATENTEGTEGDYIIPEEYRRENEVMPILYDETENETVSGDKFVFNDETTTISNENINGNVFAIVTPKLLIENTTINGNLFVMANTIELKNTTVTGSIFSMSQEFISSEIYTSDVYILGSNILIEGTIERETKIFGEKININCQTNGNAYIAGTKVTIGDNAKIFGTSNIEYSKEYNKSDNAILNNVNIIENNNAETQQFNMKNEIRKEIANWIVELIKTLIIVGFVILFTQRRFEKLSLQINAKKFTILSLKGLLWLIIVPIAAVILMIISQGYLVGIPVIAAIIYSIIIYLSLQIVSIVIGTNVKEKRMKDKGNLEFIGITLIVMSIIWVLGRLPYLGMIIRFIVIIAALGIMMKFIFNNKEKKTEPEEEKKVELDNK
ncbi:MAG: hypothetical protein ACI4UE_04740 [Candidatus Scatovivens sp.]